MYVPPEYENIGNSFKVNFLLKVVAHEYNLSFEYLWKT